MSFGRNDRLDLLAGYYFELGVPVSIKKAEQLLIVDTDVHANDPPSALAPYCEMPWRRSLEYMGKNYHGFYAVPGYSPFFPIDPVFPGDNYTARITDSPFKMREELDELAIDMAILFPNHLLYMPMLPDPNYAAALCRAYNDHLVDHWLGKVAGFKGVLVVPPQDPLAGVKEIERYAKEPHIAGVCLATAGIERLYGNVFYDPIYQAAQDAGLPVALHSIEAVHAAFPFNIQQYETALARHTIAHPFSLMANLISMVNTGVPVRFPELKIGFFEGGISWVPFLMYRMDKEYLNRRREVPFLSEPPSSYIKRFYYGTQPVEEPEPMSHLVNIFKMYDGENNTMFASDWPHYDFDHPNKVLQAPFSDEAKVKIMSGNALRFFNLQPEGLKDYGN